MLKAAVVGGPSLVFTRYHEAGVTKIRSHQIAEALYCLCILGFDANALNLSTLLEEMPRGKERVVHFPEDQKLGAATWLTEKVKNGTWFDIEIPKTLWPKFDWFVEQVTEARRTGDVEKSKVLLAEVFKLLENSGYGKLIEALERQTNVIYTKDEKVVDRALPSAYFSHLDEVGQAYELESRKPRITIRWPFQIGIAVYQLAKLRIFEFYYDFLDRYFDRRDFELIQMDTDSNYIAISAERLEDIVRPELRTEFEEKK